MAPADDREAPYTEAAFELDQEEREERRRSFGGCCRRKRGKARSVVQWGSSIATADPTSTDPIRRAVESRRNTWRGARTPCSSPPWKPIERDGKDSTGEQARSERKELDDLERALDELAERARDLAREALTAAGYHQHHRGEWRKRRVSRHREGERPPTG